MTIPNPYSSPPELNDDHDYLIEYQVFRASYFTWHVGESFRVEVRQRAQSAIDVDIGANNVISIKEHSGPPFSVVVWYRAKKT